MTYRHGDLRRALIEAGLELAREGGPAAVVLRAATRRAGVSPNAAYRHFDDRQALLDAVCSECQSLLARAIEGEQASVNEAAYSGSDAASDAVDPVERARALLRAVGVGYLRFALDEPGLFRTAFSASSDLESATSAERAGPGGLTPFQLLTTAIDGLADSGGFPAQHRPGAEFLAWSAVHGLATLLIDGPLRALDDPRRQRLIQRVIDMVEQGL